MIPTTERKNRFEIRKNFAQPIEKEWKQYFCALYTLFCLHKKYQSIQL